MIENLVLLIVITEILFVTVEAQINLAPQGNAIQRTTYIDGNGTAYDANKAIEGPATNRWSDGCSSTATGQTYAWWGLRLPTFAFITNIEIYYRENKQVGMNEFRLYHSNGTVEDSTLPGLCYTDFGKSGYPDLTQNIDCYMVAKSVYYLNRGSEILAELCYVAIYGCWKGSWGTNCTNACPETCTDQHCYPGNGLCVWGCNPQNCFNNTCDIHTGACTEGCVDGWFGKYSKANDPKSATLYIFDNHTDLFCDNNSTALQTLGPSYSSNAFTAANCKENKSKNSTKTVLAHDKYRPYLMSYGKTRSDYINTVIIPGYAVDSKMFTTQCPLVETVIDFWTMMYDHSSKIIVLLDPGNKMSFIPVPFDYMRLRLPISCRQGAPLWLEKKEMLQFDDFRIVKETENAQEEFQLTLNHTKNKEQISIKVFTAEDWTITNAVSSPMCILDLLHRVQTCWETQKGPITVVCSDGCSKSGLFVALKLVLEKMQIDGEIDIFQDQYEYCYQCIKVLLEGDSGDSLYANT